MLEKWLLRPILLLKLKILFRLELKGLQNYYAAGDRVVILCNHQSFLDPLLLAVCMPEKPAFAMNVYQAEKWYFRWTAWIVKRYTLDPSKPMSMKRVIQDLRKDAKIVLFPEGRITITGGIMKIYDGAGLMVEKSDATILPVRIDGAEYSKLSKLGGKVKRRWFPKIRVTILPPVRFPEGEPVTSRAIYDVMVNAAFMASDIRRPLLAAVLEAHDWHGGGTVIASDISRVEMNYRQLFIRATILADKLKPMLGDQTHVAVMLPNALGALVTFVALHMLGKIPCMLNFSSGPGNMLHACRIANVNHVLTSQLFVEKGKLEHVIEALQKECEIIYLEDVRKTISLADKLTGFVKGLMPHSTLADTLRHVKPDDPAVVLYTSGSEGVPKGVALSHANILANLFQACARLDLTTSDKLFNALPVFHSFGLTIGMLMPLARGIPSFLYPTPLHFRVIPELVYDTDSTIMLGTDTFFRGYARYAHSYDFHNVRLAVAGAEKLRDSTREHYKEKFDLSIYEGYGVTETSPAIAFNTPMEHKAGTVGRPFPGIEYKLEKIEGIERGGRLHVKGPNVMLGYLKADKPGVIQPPEEWYDTGDIVDVDEDGFIIILGRAKRFAKIAGEMVSLQAVEDIATHIQPESAHAAIAQADERKGEQIVLFTESKTLTRDMLVAQLREKGLGEIYLPRQIISVDNLPRLGNGKIDYPALAKQIHQG